MKRVFTTGEVAKLCGVACRTVAKWFDAGELKGYRIPLSEDRRIPKDELVHFLRKNGMPLGELTDDDRMSVALFGHPNHQADVIEGALADTRYNVSDYQDDLFALGMAVAEAFPQVIVTDTEHGRTETIWLLRRLRAIQRAVQGDGKRGERNKRHVLNGKVLPSLAVCLAAEDEQSSKELLTAGADHVLKKPLIVPDLVALIDAHRTELRQLYRVEK